MQQNLDPEQEIHAPTQQFPQRKFRILQQILRGRQSDIYLAKCANWGNYDDQEVVLRFQFSQFVFEKEINFYKWLSEYQNSKQEIDYPCNMIRILDSFFFKKQPQNVEQQYFVTVMEKGEEDLESYLKKKQQPLSDQEKIKICLDLTQPIFFLHSNEQIHGDINLKHYIKVADKFKLIDIGLIKQKSTRVTLLNETSIYSAPELIHKKTPYTEKVDVWSLACIFYEIFTSQRLFNQPTIHNISQKILNHLSDSSEVFDKISQIQDNSEIRSMIIKMLQPYPQNRINTLEAIETLGKVCPTKLSNKMPEDINIMQAYLKEFVKQFQSQDQQDNKVQQIAQGIQQLYQKQYKFEDEIRLEITNIQKQIKKDDNYLNLQLPEQQIQFKELQIKLEDLQNKLKEQQSQIDAQNLLISQLSNQNQFKQQQYQFPIQQSQFQGNTFNDFNQIFR